MIRTTSAEAFNKIKEEGLLSKRRLQVYEVLYEHGPLVGSQIARRVKKNFGSWCQSETIRNRLTELRDMGAVVERGEALDPQNGRRVILWDVSGELPKPLVKPLRAKCPHCEGSGWVKP